MHIFLHLPHWCSPSFLYSFGHIKSSNVKHSLVLRLKEAAPTSMVGAAVLLLKKNDFSHRLAFLYARTLSMHNFIAENWILQLQCPILYEEVSTTFCDFFHHLGVGSFSSKTTMCVWFLHLLFENWNIWITWDSLVG